MNEKKRRRFRAPARDERSQSPSPPPPLRGGAQPPKKRRRWDSSETAVSSEQSLDAAIAQASEAARRSQQIQDRISALTAGVDMPAIPDQRRPGFMPAPLVLDAKGRELDEKGNVIEKVERTKQFELKEAPEIKIVAPVRPSRGERFFDESLGGTRRPARFGGSVPVVERKKRKFRFVRPGAFQKRAQTLRAYRLTEELQREARERSDLGAEPVEDNSDNMSEEEFGDPNKIKLGAGSAFAEQLETDPIPAVEWWDEEILAGDSYGGDDCVSSPMITSYVQHPIPIEAACGAVVAQTVPLFRTQKEKKKIKRMQKKEKQEALADRIRMGLAEPPEPKLKLSNLMRVLGNDAITDPSAVEKKVLAQTEKRRMAHLLHNEERRLTKTERREKKRTKLQEEPDTITVAVFKVTDLSSAQHRYKVDINAQQFNLTGVCVLCGRCNVVVVEGSERGVAKYTRLMQHRIKWAGADDSGDESDGGAARSGRRNASYLVWKGISPEPSSHSSFLSSANPRNLRATFSTAKASRSTGICVRTLLRNRKCD
eukprot:654708_1